MNFRTARLQVLVDKNIANATKAEIEMIDILREIGENFTFQNPIRSKGGGWSIIDFYLPDHRLAIEVDGGYHRSGKQRRRDKARTGRLGGEKIFVIRFTNEDVLNNKESVIEKIIRNLNPAMIDSEKPIKMPFVVRKVSTHDPSEEFKRMVEFIKREF